MHQLRLTHWGRYADSVRVVAIDEAGDGRHATHITFDVPTTALVNAVTFLKDTPPCESPDPAS